MEKQKRWQLYLILAVILITLYNILPTLIWYSKPLEKPIDNSQAHVVAEEIVDRVNSLEQDAVAWVESYCHLLEIKPSSVALNKDDPKLIDVTFKNEHDAGLFRQYLPKAGALIPFLPSQLELYSSGSTEQNKVIVARMIGVHLNPEDAQNLFHFISKTDPQGQISPEYRSLVYDRAAQVGLVVAGATPQNKQVQALLKATDPVKADELATVLAKEIAEVDQTLSSKYPAVVKRYFASFTQGDKVDANPQLQQLTTAFEGAKTRQAAEKDRIAAEQKKLTDQKLSIDPALAQKASLINNNLQALDKALAALKASGADFKAGQPPINAEALNKALRESEAKNGSKEGIQTISLQGRNPYIEALVIDFGNDAILFKLYKDVQQIRSNTSNTESAAFIKEKVGQLVINEVARVSRDADEQIQPYDESFGIALNKLSNSTGFLVLELQSLAEKQSQQLANQLSTTWTPTSQDFAPKAYPVRSYNEYLKEKPEDQRLGLVIYAPSMEKQSPPEGFRMGSLYVIARGMDAILQKYRAIPNDPSTKAITADLNQLQNIMQLNGFIGYSGASYGFPPEFAKDYIFELQDFYGVLIKATREDFDVRGSKRFAVLPFTNYEQRIITLNKIDDRMQEDLLKWKEEYQTAQVDINVANHYLVPAPTENAYFANFKLNFRKFFRGDERRILKWGLDLSGGKTVRIGLRDQNNKPVTNPDDLRQAVNELYTRVNKMGVSERTIRIENENIILEFPGSQALSANELVKASAMHFYVINEKFNSWNTDLRDTVNSFLQEIWNEAVVTNRKSLENINEIAWEHMGGSTAAEETPVPRTEAARILYESGLRLANPKTALTSNAFDDTLSSIGIMRGEDFAEWEGQTHPLMILFHNYALEGASLTNIQVGYDPTEGNVLTFSVKSSYEGSQPRSGNPRNDFYAWTSQFSEDRIAGTTKEAYSHGRGWRMAVVLNGKIISSPTLRSALSDGATISGRFTQREINQLAADLKAGSLTFTPIVLSEQNVSPQLGSEERHRGIMASIVAICLVIFAMVGYYHFAGVVASCAVIFNLLIMWGVLQNLDAALTLPGIAGIVLAIGMAVDANVLVFERFREEFKLTGRLASSLQAGYRKAFSAIVDSNITTIIAAVILIQFDSGPIKGFAVTLIIGIISSMFTALFMTRYFFAGWVQNPKHKTLTMSEWIGKTHIDFLGQTKKAVIISLAVMVAGLSLLNAERHTILGMDFTGGYALTVEVLPQPDAPNYRQRATEALLANGASFNEVEVRELTRPNQLKIQLGMGMEEQGHPFYQMPEQLMEGKFTYDFQKNPRIVWVYDVLQKAGLQISSTDLPNLQYNWTVMSGQLSDTMRNNAIIALFIALLAILIYITVRFEFKYAIGAVVGLVHDVLITLGIMALFHWLGYPVQIDLQVIGAIMTIIGYSLNDTIIVFDRIREEIKIMRKAPFPEIINHALNVTLSRTLMTSGTTLLVLLALVFLGGQSIFGFSLVMTIGVVVGTLSSLYIASPVMLYFHNREVDAQAKETAAGRV